MNKNKLERHLQILFYMSLVFLALQSVWGVLVFSQIAGLNGEGIFSYLPCLFLLSESCTFYRGMAWLQGMNPYEPIVFWWAASLLIVSAWMRSLCREQGAAHE